MSLVTASNLSKSFGAQDVFSDVSLAIPHQSRIAIVGPNGVGKTTLLQILVGEEKPDGGQLRQARALKVGYLPQEIGPRWRESLTAQRTLRDYCLEAFAELRRMEGRLADLEKAMAEPAGVETALTKYGPLQEAFENAGGYTYASRVDRTLSGLGFTPEEHHKPLVEFSGGERTRALLARLLLEDPDLLTLDEPTNHLDIQAVEWFEAWLQDWPGAAVIVSHDRYFLERSVNTIWELGQGGLEAFRGNYSAYLREREARSAERLSAYEAQAEHVEAERAYIRRNIAGRNSKQAKGRRKRLERLLRDSARIRPTETRSVRIEFEGVRRSGDLVLEVKGLRVGFDDGQGPLFDTPDLRLERGECVALVGPNGAGKTTLLRTLVGDLPPLEGTIRLGAGVQIGYFAQAHADLRPDLTVFEEVSQTRPDLGQEDIRRLLAGFLMDAADLPKPIDTLSGGERGRVAMAKLSLEGANFLLLDEPTNHLDVSSQEILQEALAAFPGTILLVSHDRYLIEVLASKMWAILPTTRELRVLDSDYAAYLQAIRQAEGEARQRVPRLERSIRESGPRPQAASTAQLEKIEAKIDDLERALDQTVIELEDAGADLEEVRRLGRRYARIQADLEAQYGLWERLAAG